MTIITPTTLDLAPNSEVNVATQQAKQTNLKAAVRTALAAKIANRSLLTGEVSRQARQELGKSQQAVMDESGVPGYVLKNLETGRLKPPVEHVQRLWDYYESQGIDVQAIAAELYGAASLVDGDDDNDQPTLRDDRPQRIGFVISPQIAEDLRDTLLERGRAIDERISALMAEKVEQGLFFSGLSGTTEEHARELVTLCAEGYVIVRALGGNFTVTDDEESPATIGGVLVQMLADSPVKAAIAAPRNEE